MSKFPCISQSAPPPFQELAGELNRRCSATRARLQPGQLSSTHDRAFCPCGGSSGLQAAESTPASLFRKQSTRLTHRAGYAKLSGAHCQSSIVYCEAQRSRPMPQSDGWSREQLLIALKLYCEIPFGKMHSRNPEIIRYAKLIHRTPGSLAMKLTNFASLDPAIVSTGRKGLTKASKADKEIWSETTSDWGHIAAEIDQTVRRLAPTAAEQKVPDPPEADADYSGLTKTALIEARVGQRFFRQAVLSAYDFKCCVTGLAAQELLVASHIVPWRADPSNRLNPRNGLCLSALHDRAFDQGLIAISESFHLLLSPRISKIKPNRYIDDAFLAYADKLIQIPAKFAPDPAFLKYHRENLFR